MKWFANQRSQNRNLEGSNSFITYLLNSTSQITKLTICLIGTGVFLSGDVSKSTTQTLAAASFKGLSQQINDIAANISVKVLSQRLLHPKTTEPALTFSEDFLGSGFIVQQRDNHYLVVTNQHVLRAGEPPYQIQTADGQTYSAEIVTDLTSTKYEYDLAVLRFKTDLIYPTAKLGSSLDLEVGEPIFAAGFPHNQVDTETMNSTMFEPPQVNQTTEFSLKLGRVAIILTKALEEGYQIGYTNNVKKGMSGGPLLNSRGEVIGVNGKHAYPLWDSTEFYQDGSQPCPALQDLITRFSLAIPIEKSIELAPQLEPPNSSSQPKINRKSNLIAEDSPLVARMQAKAKAITQSCQNN